MSARNETLLLVEILNLMYNDNMRQIDTLNNMINNLAASNDNIRNLLVILLNNTANMNTNQNMNTNVPRFNRNVNNNQRNNTNSNNSRRDVRPTQLADIFNSFYLTNVQPDDISYDNHFFSSGLASETLRRASNRANNIINANRNANRNTNQLEDLLQTFFQPVNIYPTQAQIEHSTRRVRYSDIARPLNTTCPIAMEPFNDNDNVMVIRYCGHIFGATALTNWFTTSCRCPVCRHDIRDDIYEPVSQGGTPQLGSRDSSFNQL